MIFETLYVLFSITKKHWWWVSTFRHTYYKREKKKIPESEIFNIHIFLIFTTVVLQRINIVFSCLQYPQRVAQWLTYS